MDGRGRGGNQLGDSRGAAQVIDHSIGFGVHSAGDYAIIGSLSQAVTSDNRDCDIRKLVSNTGMATRPALRPEAADIFSQLDALGLKQRELAGAIGIEENKISKVRAGERQFKAAEILAAQRWLDEHAAAAADPRAGSRATTTAPSSDRETVEIQKLDLSLSMGPGTLIDDWVEAEPLSFDLAFVRTFTRTPPDRLKLVTGIGDSMRPTLQWGDLIMIDTTDRQLARQDGIYWINLYGAAGVKRLRAVGPGRVLVKSDNPDVEDQEVDAGDLRIEGRAVWVVRGM